MLCYIFKRKCPIRNLKLFSRNWVQINIAEMDSDQIPGFVWDFERLLRKKQAFVSLCLAYMYTIRIQVRKM